MKVKIVGANCSNGMKILKNLNKVERELDMNFDIEKIDANDKKKYNVTVIPALIIEDKIVSSGNVLTDREIENYIKEYCMS